ncbi:MAG TPA: helix-turn-helix domain-containing protein [Sphingomonas sp.]|nr:helix-turn-helix domain-containing protein [Sphingomonas sp.]
MTQAAFTRHHPGERLARHRHPEAYVALVLAGGYVEAGDGARIVAEPGMVIVHEGYDAHRDDFGRGGATVLNLPLLPGLRGVGRAADPDAVVGLAERDPYAAAALLAQTVAPASPHLGDWPDLLAAALAGGEEVALADWARGLGIAAPSLSRGFRQAYGVSPKRYRLEQRTRSALRRLPGWRGTFAALAAETGFADQAHLTRAVVALTGVPPQRLKVQSVQAGRS